MGRPRTGSTFLRHGVRVVQIKTDHPGARKPRYIEECKPGADGKAMTEAAAKRLALQLQTAYDAWTWDPWASKPEALDAPADAPSKPASIAVLEHAREWIKTQTYGTAAEDKRRIEAYLATDPLGALTLEAVTPRDVAAFVARLRTREARDRKPLAPRTVRNVYDVVRRAFAGAVHAGAIEQTPCRLPRGALPALADKQREFRASAVFTRDEAIALCTDARIPRDRRTLYTVLLLTGCRVGEAAALRWRHWETDRAPLGRLTVATSIERRTQTEKGTKTGVAREVPVHPTLAAVLASWKATGVAALLGHGPKPDDPILPSRGGGVRTAWVVYQRLRDDLVRLGLRHRRVHDTRRTFVSLCRDDGARGDVLRWVTHGGSKASMMDVYSTLAWATLCAEVARLRFDLPEPVSLRVTLRTGTDGGEVESFSVPAQGFEPR